MRGKTLIATGAAGLVALGVGVIAFTSFSGGGAENCATASVGADIGGPFELVNAAGETVTDADVITAPSLVYFGYTYCPDVCPMDAARNAQALDILAERGVEAQGVFISVDPERDTPEVVGDYAAAFGDDIVGLTGSEDQIRAASRAYRTFYSLPEDRSDPYYTVDHSTFTYLVMPETGFATYFNRDTTPEEMADTVACFAGS
ncbi:SCO family protein [Palleronia sediminis]|uniref:SCO family protein n=1 Tax=Palleronia sediminis TaxID=2547833 RepID=A0A4R5ZX78_9RHOB|nr:SCO family protein [Palleronia sediminis]TDL74844.1 SCO family protein [Palleronia sediminis]